VTYAIEQNSNDEVTQQSNFKQVDKTPFQIYFKTSLWVRIRVSIEIKKMNCSMNIHYVFNSMAETCM